MQKEMQMQEELFLRKSEMKRRNELEK